jgi:hypothetical protein
MGKLAKSFPVREQNAFLRCLKISAMFILTVHWDLRLVWASLTITAKFYILCLLAATVYSTFFLARIPFRLRQLLKDVASTDEKNVRFLLLELTRGIETLRQVHTSLFLLFGVCCANEVFATLRAIQYSSMSLSAARIDVFEPVTAFAFFVFAVLVYLHAFQWTVAVRLGSASRTIALHSVGV